MIMPINSVVNKTDQIDLLNRSAEYFKTKEQFNLQEFTEEVIHHGEVVDSFVEFKRITNRRGSSS